MAAAIDWTQLPPELVIEISNRLKAYTDYISLRAVSRAWRSFIPKTPTLLPPQPPWLILPHRKPKHSAFFDPSTNKSRLIYFPESSPKKRHRGSSHGFLVLLEEDSPNILLVNPVTRARVHLPPLSAFPDVVRFDYANVGREYTLVNNFIGLVYSFSLRDMRDRFVYKVVLSSAPSSDDSFMAVAILDDTRNVAYSRSGDSSWTAVENPRRAYFQDVVFHNGSLYAVDMLGELAVFQVTVNSVDPPSISFLSTAPSCRGDMVYLVSSEGELLLVTRHLEVDFDWEPWSSYRTFQFKVFRMDFGQMKWENVSSLGGRALFVGRNSSLSVSTSDFPGCMGDCIYYTDDYSDIDSEENVGFLDMGIFKLRDGSIEPLPCISRSSRSPLSRACPLWVSPNPS